MAPFVNWSTAQRKDMVAKTRSLLGICEEFDAVFPKMVEDARQLVNDENDTRFRYIKNQHDYFCHGLMRALDDGLHRYDELSSQADSPSKNSALPGRVAMQTLLQKRLSKSYSPPSAGTPDFLGDTALAKLLNIHMSKAPSQDMKTILANIPGARTKEKNCWLPSHLARCRPAGDVTPFIHSNMYRFKGPLKPLERVLEEAWKGEVGSRDTLGYEKICEDRESFDKTLQDITKTHPKKPKQDRIAEAIDDLKDDLQTIRHSHPTETLDVYNFTEEWNIAARCVPCALQFDYSLSRDQEEEEKKGVDQVIPTALCAEVRLHMYCNSTAGHSQA